jgi:peptide/nickel transport system substrate-binding protein
MMAIVRPGRALALLVGFMFAAAGCGGQKGEAGSTYKDPHPLPADTMTFVTAEIGNHGGRFVLGQTSSPKTFNAIMANETSSTDVTQLLFSGLADFNNATQQDTPLLAKSWDVSPDGLTWTWHLRRGAAFSDGHPITADDVLFSFKVAYDDKLHPSIQDLIMVGGKKFEVSAPDSYTVVTKIASPYALMVPAVGSLRIMPKHVLEPYFQRGDYASAYNTSIAPESLVTSGAWALKQFVSGEKTVLTRNPYWFGVDAKGQRLPYLDEVVFLIVADQNAAALKFQAGELDGLDNVRPEDYQSYADRQKKENFTLYDLGPAINTNFFFFNLNQVRKAGVPGKKVGDPYVDRPKYAWFNNTVFRRAVSMAIDRDAIIKSVMFGEGVKNWSNATAGNKTWFWPELPHYDYNPVEAKKLLASLGWKDTNGDGVLEDTQGHAISFTVKTNGDNTMRMQMVNFIKDDLAKVGIKCSPSGVDFNTLITNLREDFQYEAILLGGQSGVPPDPGMFQNAYRSSGPTHWWHMRQPRPVTAAEAAMDRLMDENVGTTDMAKRQQTFHELQRILNDECFLIWLPTINAKVPVKNRFGNLQPSVIPHRLLWNIDRVFATSRPAA